MNNFYPPGQMTLGGTRALPQSNPQAPPAGPPPAPPMTWVNPADAVVAKYMKDMEAAPPPPTYTPEEQEQRQSWNSNNEMLGMLAMLSGNEALGGAGGQVFKSALALRAPRTTEKGVANDLTGTFKYSPDYLRERDEAKLADLQKWQAGLQATHDNNEAQRQMMKGIADSKNTTSITVAGQRGDAGFGNGPGGGMDGLVDALGTYTIDPSQAFARMRPGARADLISAVRTKYPDYDPTTYSAKKKAAGDFASGTQGNAMRSFSVGLDHLKQLGSVADALQNGDLQVLNKLANTWAAQTGDPAPTNFEAVKDIVSKEVVKAIVGSGGGVEERRELAELMKTANSPAQLKGVIKNYIALMGAQHDALKEQRDAAGVPKATLPNYDKPPAGGKAPVRVKY